MQRLIHLLGVRVITLHRIERGFVTCLYLSIEVIAGFNDDDNDRRLQALYPNRLAATLYQVFPAHNPPDVVGSKEQNRWNSDASSSLFPDDGKPRFPRAPPLPRLGRIRRYLDRLREGDDVDQLIAKLSGFEPAKREYRLDENGCGGLYGSVKEFPL